MKKYTILILLQLLLIISLSGCKTKDSFFTLTYVKNDPNVGHNVFFKRDYLDKGSINFQYEGDKVIGTYREGHEVYLGYCQMQKTSDYVWYKFDGWYYTPECNRKDKVVANSLIMEKDIILYGKWEASYLEMSLNYFLDGGLNDSRNPDSITYDELPLALYNPIRPGYKFLGWYGSYDFKEELLTRFTTISIFYPSFQLSAFWMSESNSNALTPGDTYTGSSLSNKRNCIKYSVSEPNRYTLDIYTGNRWPQIRLYIFDENLENIYRFVSLNEFNLTLNLSKGIYYFYIMDYSSGYYDFTFKLIQGVYN